MFVHYRTEGFILKKTGQAEANLFLIVYTEKFGKIKILARSVRKISSKLKSFIEIFDLSEIEFIQGKNYKTLTDAILITRFKDSRKNLLKLSISFKIVDLLDKLIKGEEKDEKVWLLLKETFEKLNELKDNLKIESVYYYFFWNLVYLLGYQPELYYCTDCQKKLLAETNYFDSAKTRIICQNCLKKVKLETREISSETIKILRIILEKNKQTFFKLKIEKSYLKQLEQVSDYYFSQILKQN
jgi:DNA repair protein RecO (recombination protein O)